ncbi:MAG: hypothetical protein IT266_08280 [Saprospiraceae bacterium]|nr:hypothetical protein [Saprospiraceae bacterium]
MFHLLYGQKDCSRPASGLTPLTDFESGEEFMGFTGGLYGNQSNQKPDRYREDAIRISWQVKPLNAKGEVDPDGVIGFIAIGASNPRTEFDAFTRVAEAHASINPKLKFVNTCIGGQGIQKMNQKADPYWVQAQKLLDSLGMDVQQVQVVWIETENTANGNVQFPACAMELTAEYQVLLKTVHEVFPNVKICYLAARAYSGYAIPVAGGVGKGLLHPRDYYNGWAVRFLMDKVIAGETGYRYSGDSEEIPFTTWGNYSWSDGQVARKDGFFLDCQTDVGADGLHLSSLGEQKVGQLMFDFFSREETATPWFFESITRNADVGKQLKEVRVASVPSTQGMVNYFTSDRYSKAMILSAQGILIGEYDTDTGNAVQTGDLRPGIYWMSLFSQASGWSRPSPFMCY